MKLSELLIYTGEIPLKIIIWSVYIGVVAAVIATYITKSNFGKFVSALIEKNAATPETALSPNETGIKINLFIKLALKNHLHYNNFLVAITAEGKFYANYTYADDPPTLKPLQQIVRQTKRKKVNDSIPEKTETYDNQNTDELSVQEQNITFSDKKERVKFDPMTARFYLPKEVQSKASSVYGYKKTNIGLLILGLIAFAAVAYFSEFIIEALQNMIDKIGQ